MARLFLLIISFSYFTGFSQAQSNATSFDSIFYDIAVNVSSSNPSRALHLADSLYTYSIDDHQRVRSLMLSADVYNKQEKRQEAIEYAMKALKVAESSKDYSFQARIYGFMSTQYRLLGFLDKGKDYLIKGIEVSNKIEDKIKVTKFQAMANHELADFAMDTGDYEDALQYLDLAILGYEKEENEQLKYHMLSNAIGLLARCHMALNNEEKALEYFLKANQFIKKSESENTIYAALVYQGIGAMYLEKKELDSAEVYLKNSLLISAPSNHGSLKELIYGSMADYYRERGQLDSASIYASKYREKAKSNKSKKTQMVNNEFNRVTSNSEQNSQQATSLPLIAGVSITAVLVVLVVFYFTRKKPSTQIDEGTDSENETVLTIANKTLEELLEKLKDFEKSESFLDKNMSFSHLVSILNTNAKYLNYTLKNKKEKDFNTYINDLRIEYIISKLDTDSQYLNYKISYLAEISGFSSHSNFSANFKRYTEFSPSEYIEGKRDSA